MTSNSSSKVPYPPESFKVVRGEKSSIDYLGTKRLKCSFVHISIICREREREMGPGRAIKQSEWRAISAFL